MRTVTEPGAALFGYTRRQVLAWLFGHPDERFFLREISRKTDVALGAAQRELALLEAAGLVLRDKEGRQVYFQANRESPIFADLQQILLKTTGAVPVLRAALAPFARSIRVAWIFGSVARGADLRASSDVDLIVVGGVSFEEVVGSLSRPEKELGREINPTVYSAREFQTKVNAGHHFLTSILKEPKKFVIGGESELGRLAEERVASGAQDERKRNLRTPRNRRS